MHNPDHPHYGDTPKAENAIEEADRILAKMAGTEPSRGAQRAARKVWAIGYVGEPPKPAPADEVEILQAAEIIDRETGHVVLLEACKGLLEELRLIRMKDTNAVYDPTIRVRAEAAIKQAERT